MAGWAKRVLSAARGKGILADEIGAALEQLGRRVAHDRMGAGREAPCPEGTGWRWRAGDAAISDLAPTDPARLQPLSGGIAPRPVGGRSEQAQPLRALDRLGRLATTRSCE